MNDPKESSEISATTKAEKTTAILKARARDLARPPRADKAAGASLEVIEFRLANERYAIEQVYVREIYPFKDLTPLPCTPAFFIGIVNVRGRMLPVIDVKQFFDLPQAGITDLHVIMVVQHDDVELGILADAIGAVVSIPLTSIQASLPTLTGIRADYLKGIAAESLVILDMARLLTDPKMTVNEEVQA